MRQILVLIALIVLISFKIDIGKELPKYEYPQLNTLLNRKVPHFTGYLVNETAVDESFFADKVVLLNFMFFGCQGCMEELPILAKLNERYINRNFMIVTIMGNGIEDIKSYQGIGDTSKIFYQIRKMWKYDIIKNPIIAECREVNRLAPPNSIYTCTENISKKFFINTYPTNLLVDKSGIIIKRYKNLLKDTDYFDLQSQIDSLLKLN